MMLVQHHTKYQELHGVDEVVMMEKGAHRALHNRLRREGKCNIPPAELLKISGKAHLRTDLAKVRRAAYIRTDVGKKKHLKNVMEYQAKNVRDITFHNPIGPSTYLVEKIAFNSINGNVYVSHWFDTRGDIRYIDIN